MNFENYTHIEFIKTIYEIKEKDDIAMLESSQARITSGCDSIICTFNNRPKSGDFVVCSDDKINYHVKRDLFLAHNLKIE